jgi:hypothetical protein
VGVRGSGSDEGPLGSASSARWTARRAGYSGRGSTESDSCSVSVVVAGGGVSGATDASDGMC